jgi:hypothetical protein
MVAKDDAKGKKGRALELPTPSMSLRKVAGTKAACRRATTRRHRSMTEDVGDALGEESGAPGKESSSMSLGRGLRRPLPPRSSKWAVGASESSSVMGQT